METTEFSGPPTKLHAHQRIMGRRFYSRIEVWVCDMPEFIPSAEKWIEQQLLLRCFDAVTLVWWGDAIRTWQGLNRLRR